jgi:putative molybdenum carrier protein
MIIVSGGQSGVDRAALDVAVARGIDYAGWCPRGGWAEDFPTPPGLLAHYPKLEETPLAEPTQRTEWNVRDAHACLIVLDAGGIEVSHGTELARELAHRYRRPVFTTDLAAPDAVKDAALWLRVQKARHGVDLKLAIGGPRESEAPGIYERAKHFIDMLLDA